MDTGAGAAHCSTRGVGPVVEPGAHRPTEQSPAMTAVDQIGRHRLMMRCSRAPDRRHRCSRTARQSRCRKANSSPSREEQSRSGPPDNDWCTTRGLGAAEGSSVSRGAWLMATRLASAAGHQVQLQRAHRKTLMVQQFPDADMSTSRRKSATVNAGGVFTTSETTPVSIPRRLRLGVTRLLTGRSSATSSGIAVPPRARHTPR